MRILHISDTHGLILKLDLNGIDAVVHSGDFLPNRGRGGNSYSVSLETEFQRDWTARNFDDLMEMVPDPIPLLICRGNHDFINPSEYLGVNARDLSGQLVEVCGIKFFGFPFTPWLAGEWWGELTERQEEHAMEGLLLVLEREHGRPSRVHRRDSRSLVRHRRNSSGYGRRYGACTCRSTTSEHVERTERT